MENAIDFGKLVLKGDVTEAVQKTAPKKKAAAPVFECIASSGVDFVVKRTTATTSRLLVMLVSQDQYYVKDERTGVIEMLTDKVLESFFQGLGDKCLHIGCSWLEHFSNSKTSREALTTLVRMKGFKQAAICGLVDFGKYFDYRGQFNARAANTHINRLSHYAEASMPLMKYIGEVSTRIPHSKKELLDANAEALLAIFKTYGLDRSREFIDRFIGSAAFESADDTREAQLQGLSELLSIIPTRAGIVASRYRVKQHAAYGTPVSFQFDKLCDYLFDQSAHEGFTSLWDWLVNWKDTLLLQLYVSGKIVDKYPDNLLSAHQILSSEAARMQKAIDEKRWAKAETAMRDFDYAPEGSKYIVIHPTTPDAMRAEAVAQSNCLASYIDRVIEGRTMIFFVRKASDPEKSLLTIEVSSSFELRQVKARFNREADSDAMLFVAQWCREKGISLGAYAGRMAALSKTRAA